VIESQLETRQPRGIYQSDKFMLGTPRVIGYCRIRESETENSVSDDSAAFSDGQCFAPFRGETLHRIAIQANDAHLLGA
jgi:hypothetical protein